MAVVVLCAGVLSACGAGDGNGGSSPTEAPLSPGTGASASPFETDPTDLEVTFAPYEMAGYDRVDVQRIDLRTVTVPGVCIEGDESGCTLEDVLADTDRYDDFKVDIPVHLTAADYPEDGLPRNAELRQRGGRSRLAAQKSFRVRFDDKDALWRGERRLLLNKHPYETTRIRNALAMSLMAEVPHLDSFRTQLVNLWIDDGLGPVDQGLYTHVEAPGGRYLRRRGLDDEDRLYKAIFFRFSAEQVADLAVDASGRPVDERRFESILEVENGEGHDAVASMMRAMHDPALDFESVLDRHFNRNNVMVWMAMNLLLNQHDAVHQNYILRNPVGTERFYFVPWDYDQILDVPREPADDVSAEALRDRQMYGYAGGAQNRLVERFLRMPGAHERLLAVADWLVAHHLTPQNVSQKASRLSALAEPFQSRLPDAAHNPNHDPGLADDFASRVVENLERMRTRFTIPMPPRSLPVRRDGDELIFSAEPGLIVPGGAITHEFQVASTIDFEPGSLLAEVTGLPGEGETIEWRLAASRLPVGEHYVRVIARSETDPERDWQVSINQIVLEGTLHRGTMAFEVR